MPGLFTTLALLLAGGAPAITLPKPAGGLHLGADLSYLNETEDCGAVYRSAGKPVDPFALLAGKAAISCSSDCGTTRHGRSTATSPM